MELKYKLYIMLSMFGSSFNRTAYGIEMQI